MKFKFIFSVFFLYLSFFFLLYAYNKENFSEILKSPQKFNSYIRSLEQINFYYPEKVRELSSFITYIKINNLDNVFTKETNYILKTYKRLVDYPKSVFLNVGGKSALRKKTIGNIYFYFHKSIDNKVISRIAEICKNISSIFKMKNKKKIWLIISSYINIPYSPYLIRKELPPEKIIDAAIKNIVSQYLDYPLSVNKLSPYQLGTLNFFSDYFTGNTINNFNHTDLLLGTNLKISPKKLYDINHRTEELVLLAKLWEHFLITQFKKYKNKIEFLTSTEKHISDFKNFQLFLENEKEKFQKQEYFIYHLTRVSFKIHNLNLIEDFSLIPAFAFQILRFLKKTSPSIPSVIDVFISQDQKLPLQFKSPNSIIVSQKLFSLCQKR